MTHHRICCCAQDAPDCNIGGLCPCFGCCSFQFYNTLSCNNGAGISIGGSMRLWMQRQVFELISPNPGWQGSPAYNHPYCCDDNPGPGAPDGCDPFDPAPGPATGGPDPCMHTGMQVYYVVPGDEHPCLTGQQYWDPGGQRCGICAPINYAPFPSFCNSEQSEGYYFPPTSNTINCSNGTVASRFDVVVHMDNYMDIIVDLQEFVWVDSILNTTPPW